MTHRIGKIDFELQFAGVRVGEAFQRQREGERFCRELLLQALEALFNRLAGPNEVLRAGRVEIQIDGLKPGPYWEEEALARIIQALEMQLGKQLLEKTAGRSDVHFLSPEAALFESALFFLEQGALPTAAGHASETDLQTALLETAASNAKAHQRLIALLRKSPAALRRLTEQYPPSWLDQLAAVCFNPLSVSQTDVLQKIKTYFIFIFNEKNSFKKTNIKFNEYIKNIEKTLESRFHALAWPLLLEGIKEKEAFSARFFSLIWPEIKASLPPAVLPLLSEAIVKQSGFLEKGKDDTALTNKVEKSDLQSRGADEHPNTPLFAPKSTDENPNASLFTPESAEFSAFFQEFKKDKASETEQESLRKQDQKNRLSEAEKPDFWYLNGAGLILLHSFLPTFLKKLGLLDENSGLFKNEDDQHRAVYCLHYLAQNRFDAPEYELILPKFLCGLSPETPLHRLSLGSMPPTLPDEAELLLKTVIRYWEKLGTTSPAGLQESFLRRPGKLSRSMHDGWKLQIENSGIDVLLNYLPWGFGMVKLPWMPELLHTEWNFDTL